MAKIISFSVSEEHEKKMTQLEKEIGFSGRSELLRAALDVLEDRNKKLDNISGNIDALLLVNHSHNSSDNLHKITHKHHGLIKTQIHSDLKKHMCLDLLILSGDAMQIKSLYDSLLLEKKLLKVQLLIL